MKQNSNWCGLWTDNTAFNFKIIGFLVAVEIMLSFSPFGFILIKPVSLTTSHIAVMLGAMWAGPVGGGILGLVFGLCSMWKAEATAVNAVDIIFAPFRHGTLIDSLMLSVGSRTLYGIIAGLLFVVLFKLAKKYSVYFLPLMAVVFDRLHSALVYHYMDTLFQVKGISALGSLDRLFRPSTIVVCVFAAVVLVAFYYFLQSKAAEDYYKTWIKIYESNVKEHEVKVFHFIIIVLFIISLMYHITTRTTLIYTIEKVHLSAEGNIRFVHVLAQYLLAVLAMLTIIVDNFKYRICKEHMYNHEQLQEKQEHLEALAAEQESQIEETNSLNRQLQENQAKLEEAAAENEAQLEEIKELNLGLIESHDRLNHDFNIISSISQFFNGIFYINLSTYRYIEINPTEIQTVRQIAGASGDARITFNSICKQAIHSEFQRVFSEFTEVSTLSERLQSQQYISLQFFGITQGWMEGTFIAAGRDVKGRCTYAVWAIRSINEQKEKELLNQRQLETAKLEAEAANKAKTTFLNNMSHDIRTPMNAILGFAKLMERNLDNPKLIGDYLKKINYSGKYLLTIINNILDMARIESGRTAVYEELIDLEEQQGAVVALFEASAKKKNITLKGNWSIQHRYVYCDSVKCQQIAVNLISNSIKYTPNGGSVTVDMEELPSSRQGYADYCFTVADNGIGMSKEYQEQLFEAFSRERNTTHSKVVGTGLGMAIVKKHIDMLGGTITVDSEPGRGSSFKVVLPFKLAEDNEAFVAGEEAAFPYNVDFSGKRILLAEDNELNAEIAIAILEEEGFIIEHAEDGAACVDMLTKKPAGYYNLILMDIQMPNLNGYQATEKIRGLSDKAKAGIPILAMTANAFDEDKHNVLEAGMDGFCTKPIDLEQFNKELARLLK